MAYQQGYGARIPHHFGNMAGGSQYGGGVPVHGGGMTQYPAVGVPTYQYPSGAYMHHGQFSAFSTVPAHMGNTPYPEKETVEHGKTEYIVEHVLVEPANDPMRMSNGLRVLTDPILEMQVVEKNMTIMNDAAAHRAKSEINALKQIRNAGGSPNINVIYDAFWTDGSKNCVLLLEHCDQETVQDMITRGQQAQTFIGEKLCWHVLEGMLTALTMCHFGIRSPDALHFKYENWNTICHLDIKPANVFLTTRMIPGHETFEHRVVLGDFGCAVTRKDVDTGKNDINNLPGGTVGWIPPEITRAKDGRWVGMIGKPVDVWQTGGIIQAMCLLSFEPDLKLVEGGRPCGPDYSMELNHVVSKAMEKNFRTRGTAIDIWREFKKGREDWMKSQQI